MSVHVLVCLLETLSGVVQCFSQLRPPMSNDVFTSVPYGKETLHPAGSGVEREWREVGRSEKGRRGGGKGGRIEKGVRVVLQSVVSPTLLIT